MVAVMPFKHNAARRHRIGKMKFKVANWPEFEAGLRRRGSLTPDSSRSDRPEAKTPTKRRRVARMDFTRSVLVCAPGVGPDGR